jgi:hypothetical protein
MRDRMRLHRKAKPNEAVAPPQVEHANSLLQLQRSAGNQATAAALKVGEADSPAEREADAVAAWVGGDLRTPSDPAPADPSAGLPGLLRRARGGGQAIDDATQARLAPALGDLGDVRVHTDEAAARMSAELGARAFTSGQDIFFGAGERQAGGDALLAHEATHAVQDAGGEIAHRFPANVLSAPNTGWAGQVGGAKRPGEGISGGVYILTAASNEDPVQKVVIKPVFNGENGIGNKETGEQLSFADNALSSLLGISAPASRVVSNGSGEFGELLQVVRPYAPAKPDPNTPNADLWHDVAEASSFIVMGEVPNAKTLTSLATEAGKGDQDSMDLLSKVIFDPELLAQLGRLAVGDMLLGNNDRMVARAMNIGNLMVDGKGTVHAIDSFAALDKFDPRQMLDTGSSSSSLQGGWGNTKQTFIDKDDKGSLLDGFYGSVGKALDGVYGLSANTPVPEAPENVMTPRMWLDLTYGANKPGLLAAFDRGWNDALAQVRALATTEEGRGKMKALTDQYEGTEVGESLSYEALLANAMYLGARSEGKSHQESAADPAALAAVKQLSAVNPTAFEVPIDEFHWNRMPRLGGSAASADLEEIRSLPAAKAMVQTVTGKAKSLQSNPQRVELVGRRAIEAKGEVDELGTKSRGVFKKKDQVRNRQYAGYAVADSYLLGTGSLRGASIVNSLARTGDIVGIAAGGNLKASQAQAVLPAARALADQPAALAQDMQNYAQALKGAAKDVGKLKKYAGRRALVGELETIAANAETAVGFADDILTRFKPQQLLDALLAKSRGE